MKRFTPIAILIGVAGFALAGVASAQQAAAPKQYIFPAKGQTPEQQQQDEAACSSWSTQQTGFDPAKPPAPPQPAPTPAPQKGAGLRGAARLMPQELSGGMARRVALARAIVMDPDILLYDEPFAGLDPISMGVVLRLIRSLNDALGISSVVVTHDVREISQIADASYILSDGRVVASGTPAELREHPSPVVHQFMEGLADGPVSFHYPAPDYRTQLLDRSEVA